MKKTVFLTKCPNRILAASAASLLAIFAATPSASAGSLLYSGVTITETFDLLGTAGITLTTLTGNATNDGTSPWFAGVAGNGLGGTTQAAFATQALTSVSDGSVAVVNPGARLFNNGQLGVNPLEDRALGSGNTGGDPVLDLSITNSTASALGSFSITFDTEFWRGGVNAAPIQSLGYQLFYSPTGAASTWTAFTGTQVTHAAFASGADLDGNDPLNRVVATVRGLTLATPIAAGQTFFLRFVDNNDPTNSPDANIAIDNFSFTATTANPTLVYNLIHTVGGAPNGVLEVSAAQYWLNGAAPAGFNANDNLVFSQNGSPTISVPASVSAGTLTVSNTTGLYTLNTAAGATLTAVSLNGTGPLAKSGPGTLLLTAAGTATGGLEISGGTVSVPTSSGVGAITQNVTISGNAVLEFSATGAAASEFNNATTATRTLTLSSGGATISVNPATGATGSGVTLNRADSLIGGETITKTGGGVLRLGAAQTTLTSSWIVNAGTLETSVGGGLGSGISVTVNAGGSLIALGNVVGGIVVPNNITLAGGSLGTKSGNLATYSGTVNVSADSALLGRSNSTPANAQIFTISGGLTGSAALTIPGATPLAADDLGGVILTNITSTYSGNITVTSLQTLTSAAAGGVGSTLSTAGVTLAGGTLQVRDNGAGNDGTLAYGNNVTVIAPTDATFPGVATLNLDRATGGASTGNTVALGTLAIGNQTLAVTGANGYKARFTGPTTLSGDATFDVATEVILSGAISGSFGLTKTGAGRMALDAVNLYTGATTVSGGTLGGTGSVAGILTVNTGGNFAPGTSPAIFGVGGNLTFNAGSTLTLDIAHGGGPTPVAGTDYDRVNVGTGGALSSTGTVSLDGSSIELTIGTGIQLNDIFFVVINDGADPITGTFCERAGRNGGVRRADIPSHLLGRFDDRPD